MKNILATMSLLGVFSLNAQTIEKQVVGSTGGTYNNTITVTATVGEPMVKTYTSGSFTLTQGYQQSNDSTTSSIKEIEVKADFKLYPNPTLNNAILELKTSNANTNVFVNIYSSEGKIIFKQDLNLVSGVISTVSIDLENEARGIYFIKIYNNTNALLKTIRLVKN